MYLVKEDFIHMALFYSRVTKSLALNHITQEPSLFCVCLHNNHTICKDDKGDDGPLITVF